MDEQFQKTLAKLRALREKQGLTLKPSPFMTTEIKALDGTVKPFKLRDYQVQMVFHLLTMPRFIVGDDTGLGKCITRDTLIETQRGLVPVGQLQPRSDMLPDTFEPVEGWQVRLGSEMVPVKSFYYSGTKPTRKVRTRYGFEVEGSLVHPLLVWGSCGEEWRQTQEITPGDFLCVDRGGQFPDNEPALMVPVVGGQITGNAKTYPVPNHLNPDLARLLGYIIGEGWVNAKYEFSISQCPEKNPEAHADIFALLESQFGWTPATEGLKDTHVWSVFLRTYLEHMGVDYTLSVDKSVPEPVLRATRASTREFLRGLFEGEGSAVGTGGIEFSTASEVLGKQVQLLLLRFGIVSNRSVKRVSRYPGNTYWRLTIFGDDARRFQEEIGFVSSRKRERLVGVLPESSNPNHDTIPHLRDPVEALREALAAKCRDLGWSISQKWGSSFYNTLGHIRQGRRNPTYRFLWEFVDICDEVDVACASGGKGRGTLLLGNEPACLALRRVLGQGYFYDPVVEVQEGFKEVVDIEVDDPRHCFVGNGLVNHNTAESIGALCYLWMRDPNEKAIILTKKSAVGQWAKEFGKFTLGVRVVVVQGSPAKRRKLYEQFRASTGPTVLISGYRTAVNDIGTLQDWEDYTLIADEATVFKNPSSQVHQVMRHLAGQAKRVWGLTATLIKNNLVEGYGIYQVVVPGLFQHSKNGFMNDYCIVRMVRVKGNRQVPQIAGYRPSDIQRFKDKIDPYYLGRPKHDVADELPVLQTKDVFVGLTRFQHEKYQEALGGLLELGTGEEKETDRLTAIIYCQEIVNHPYLVGYEKEKSEKLDTLVDMLSDGGELEGEKVIVFTRFKKMVDCAIPVLEKAGVRCVRVTGKETDDERQAAMEAFQDFKSDVKVIWITMAGGDAINLQAAKAIVFYDSPWSAGDYLQILGRMIRIGSLHDRVYAIHLIAEDTVDERVQKVKNEKMKLIQDILGQRIKGEKAPSEFLASSGTRDLFDCLVADAHAKKTRG